MFHRVCAVVCLLICACGLSYAQNITKFDARDFYFYDEANLITRLRLAPKIVVHFLTTTPVEEQNTFLNTFSPSDRKEYPKNSSRRIIGFPSSTSEERIFDMLTDINRSGIARGIPVVLVNNIEAIAEGFVVEPRTPLAPETLSQHLKSISEFSTNQTKQEQNAWLFMIDDIKPPLHIYSLINLIHEDTWVKSVRPQFTYLHAPVIAVLEVMPISGTVDETRVIRLSLHVFDDAIKIREDLLPQFGEGKFITDPLPPPLFFFPSVGERELPRVDRDARGYVMSVQWKFRMFAVGEWTIPSQTIAYERMGEQLTIPSPPGPFVVTSLVGRLAIKDMPSPQVLPTLEKPNLPAPQKTPQLPLYWFDDWIAHPLSAARYSFFAALALAVVTIIFPLTWGIAAFREKSRKNLEMKMLVAEWMNICREASDKVCLESYRKLEDVLMSMLILAFPDMLPRNPVLKDIESFGARDSFDHDSWDAVCVLYEEFECTHAKDFMPDKQTLRGIADKIVFLIAYLMPKINATRGSR